MTSLPLLLFFLASCSISTAQVSFYVVGDVPYSDLDECLLPFELEKLDPSDGVALIHLGDVRGGKPNPYTGEPADCPEQMYKNIAEIFEASPVTTFFLPGDNGWLDCYDAQEAYTFWERHLFDYNERTDLGWPAFPATVYRWGEYRATRRSELFSFLLDNVLFIGLSLPGSGRNKDNEWTPRDSLTRDNLEWTLDNLEYFANVAQAVVILGHDATSSVNYEFYRRFRSIIVNSLVYSRLPILVFEDGHQFDRQDAFLGLSNIVRIALDDTTTPMKMTVNPLESSLDDVFQHDRRCPCSTKNGPRTYLTSDPYARCNGVCTEAHEACRWENSCRNDKLEC